MPYRRFLNLALAVLFLFPNVASAQSFAKVNSTVKSPGRGGMGSQFGAAWGDL